MERDIITEKREKVNNKKRKNSYKMRILFDYKIKYNKGTIEETLLSDRKYTCIRHLPPIAACRQRPIKVRLAYDGRLSACGIKVQTRTNLLALCGSQGANFLTGDVEKCLNWLYTVFIK